MSRLLPYEGFFHRFKEGNWGVRVIDADDQLSPGDVVMVKNKKGETQPIHISNVVFYDKKNHVAIANFEAELMHHRSKKQKQELDLGDFLK